MRRKVLIIAGLIGLGVAGRLLPHFPNVTPITAIAFAASKKVGRWWGLLIPLAAMLASDLVIGWYSWRIMLSVYLSFAVVGLLGWLGRRGLWTAAGSLLASSLLFFLITNAAVWAFSPWYEKSLDGLLLAYTLGLPFLRNMLLGDVLYAGLLLGAAVCIKKLLSIKSTSPHRWGFCATPANHY